MSIVLMYADGWWYNRQANRFYDLYVARLGGLPTRDELISQRLAALRGNPIRAFGRLFERDRWGFLGLLYRAAPDDVVEARRRPAQLAFAAFLAWPILAFPIAEFVDSTVMGHSLPPDWLERTLLGSAGWALVLGAAIAWAVGRLNKRPGQWRMWSFAAAVAGLALLISPNFLG